MHVFMNLIYVPKILIFINFVVQNLLMLHLGCHFSGKSQRLSMYVGIL
jgi:hypothetical protein